MKQVYFLPLLVFGLVGTGFGQGTESPKELPAATSAKLPRWRGFNLLNKFTLRDNKPFEESDFQIVSELGFNFVRLPMDYRCWIVKGDWDQFNEQAFKEIDQTVTWGKKYHVHVSLNFHRGPGYCVNSPKEPTDLWTDPESQEIFAKHWAFFAKRYRGIPNSQLSFDLLNEPGDIDEKSYVQAMTKAVEAIRREDPSRLIIVEGIKWGNQPVPELAGLGVAQSTRGYNPMSVSHYRASWIKGSDTWTVPSWPVQPVHPGPTFDRKALWKQQIEPWKKLEALGVGVHVGEWGAFNKTPHEVVLAWMRDCLDNWKKAGWGWALWNLRGSFGILDSERADVQYEDFHGHKLDRKMLELLQAY